MSAGAETIIIGGGVIGAAAAYYLARAGVRVLLLERDRIAGEASGANAGMIGVAGDGPEQVTALTRWGLDELTRLEQELVHGFELRRDGRLFLAHSEAEQQGLRDRLPDYHRRGVAVDLLEHEALCALEPLLNPETVCGALLLHADGQLNPFLLTHALAASAVRLGAAVRTGVEVTGLLQAGSRVVGVRTGAGDLPADHVVLAAGSWAGILAGSFGLELPVTPGQGEMIVTEPLPPLFPRVLRGPAIGLRQTVAGNVMIGSTVQYVGFNKEVSARVGQFILHWQHVIPCLRTVRVLRTWAGLRPMSGDGLPYIGAVPGCDGLWLAAGHSRTGLSWAPGTGWALAQLLTTGRSDLDVSPMAASRIATVPAVNG